MPRGTLNLGILAHVDAGKTTLTERLLYAAGVIDTAGSVDAGTTRTDSLELERRRGITIRSAVVSFPVAGVTVNVIDTPGHPDFIAEVERVLGVLDGAVLAISAVEGVQPQTRVLMRALHRLQVPCLLFVNKIDRTGADCGRALEAIRRRLTPAVVPMGLVSQEGTPDARFAAWDQGEDAFRTELSEILTIQDDELLAAYIEDEASVSYPRLRARLVAQTQQTVTHPVYFGSAVTGAGVAELIAGIAELLPTAAGDQFGPASGRVFKIERGPTGEKIAYARLFSGAVHTRDTVRLGSAADGKVTAIRVFDGGRWVRSARASAGEIAQLWGLAAVRVGDPIGQPPPVDDQHHFAPPTLETVVVAHRPEEGAALRRALGQLAEQDPLINVRQEDVQHGLAVSLYGEVQKEVVQATLAADYGIDVEFHGSTTICVERPSRRGEATQVLNTDTNPFNATIGLRVDPAPAGSGVELRLQVDERTVPTYVYQSRDGFAHHMEQYVRQTLQEGRYGWQVTDCVVTMVQSGYPSADGPPSTRGSLSTAADFRKLTPLVLMQALERAATVVCEPVLSARLEVPAGAIGAVLGLLPRLAATVQGPPLPGELAVIEAELPANRVPELQRRLPGLTGGEGVFETRFGGYRPVAGEPPTRPRTTPDPRRREEYLAARSRPASG